MAQIADGIFNIADNVLTVVSAGPITQQMLATFAKAVRAAYNNKTEPEQLALEVEKIDPSFGNLIRQTGTSRNQFLVVLLMILYTISRCCNVHTNIDTKLDANRLIEQLTHEAPSSIISDKPDKK
ncbi:MAG: hypothetical protein ACLP9L_08110 [Thermoguttaceae bacterium]